MNTFGTKLRITTFGESHGPAIGGIIDGFPAGFKIDFDKINSEVSKRSPGSSPLVTQRKESDVPELLSGISTDGITLGTPIGFIIRNSDNRSKDYSELEEKYRPNHADYTYDIKYGIRDYRGGGRASARDTANWVVAGAFASQWLEKHDITVYSSLTGVGSIDFTPEILKSLSCNPYSNPSLEISEETRNQMEQEIENARMEGDSIGGKVTCVISGLKAGIGDPVFDKLHARLALAMMSINAAKGFEYGLGSKLAECKGSETLDIFSSSDEGITKTNYSGGIQGGISNGMPVFFTVSFKPTPTIMKEVNTINKRGENVTLKMKGRHDPCVAVRAVAVVKAMAALTIADFLV